MSSRLSRKPEEKEENHSACRKYPTAHLHGNLEWTTASPDYRGDHLDEGKVIVGISPGNPRSQSDAFVVDIYAEDGEWERAANLHARQQQESEVSTHSERTVGSEELIELSTAHPERAQSHS